MQYMLLIYDDPATEPQPGTEAFEAMMSGYFSFTETVAADGVLIRGDELAPPDTATTVSVRDDRLTLSDGPFAETREALGGYYLLDVADLDQAISYARLIPGAMTGRVEIRPVVDHG